MAEKSIDEQIADLNEQIKELEDKRFKLEHPTQEYPKYIAKLRRTVATAEEEKKALAGSGDEIVAPSSADEKRQLDEVRNAEAEDLRYRTPIKKDSTKAPVKPKNAKPKAKTAKAARKVKVR